jgi:hypothetical protein
MRRDAIVGKAIPGGKVENLDFRCEEGERPLELAEPLPVARDEDERLRLDGHGKVGERLADIAVRHG